MAIGNSDFHYENTRARTREYIRDYLFSKGFSEEQVVWHRFEWREQKAEGRNITTTTWTGINFLIWPNRTECPGQKLRILGAHYDTKIWGLNKTNGAHDNLAGTAILMEMAVSLMQHQQRRVEKGQPELPYLLVR
jgi:hypothetical protein